MRSLNWIQIEILYNNKHRQGETFTLRNMYDVAQVATAHLYIRSRHNYEHVVIDDINFSVGKCLPKHSCHDVSRLRRKEPSPPQVDLLLEVNF